MTDSLTFSIGAEGDVTVRSYDELIKWLQKERSRWAWMIPGDGRTDRHGLASELTQTWNGLIAQVESLKAQGQTLDYVRQFLTPLSSGFLMISTTADGSTVLDIRESAGEVAAMAAFGFLKQRLTAQHMGIREELLGMILSVMPDLRNPADWTERLKRERSNFRMATRSLLEKLDQEADSRDRAARVALERARGMAFRLFRRRRLTWSEVQSDWEQSASDAVVRIETRAGESLTSITNAEASYREFMRLKAPVEYWEAKGKEHGTRETNALQRLYWFFPLTLIILAGVFIAAGAFLLNHPDAQNSKAPVALYVVVSGGLLLISTLAFWIGRILTKLYLSEHHLRNDAEERATMTTTYLALTAENAAGDADRQIILTALFRATPDGIVKEDGPGDIGLQGLLAKFIAK